MATQVTLTVPDPVYEEAEELAQANNCQVNEVLTEALAQTFSPFPVHEDRPAMLREQAAFKAMHAELLKKYAGKYVAICRGEVVDHDSDFLALLERREEKYPGQVVLIEQVLPEPERTLFFRSPRLVRN